MRKFVAFLMIPALCLGLLCGCGQPGSTPGTPTPDTSPNGSQPSGGPSVSPDNSPYGLVTVQDGNFGELTFDAAYISDNCIYIKPGSNVTVTRSNNDDVYAGTEGDFIYLYGAGVAKDADGTVFALMDNHLIRLTVTSGCIDDLFSQLADHDAMYPIVESMMTRYILIPNGNDIAYIPTDNPSDEPTKRTYGTLTVEDVNAGFLAFDQACQVDNIVYVKAGSNVTVETVRSEGEYGYIGPNAMVIFAYSVIEGDGIQVKDYTYEDFVAREIPVYTGSVDGITEQLSRLGGNMLPVILTMEDYLILVIE